MLSRMDTFSADSIMLSFAVTIPYLSPASINSSTFRESPLALGKVSKKNEFIWDFVPNYG